MKQKILTSFALILTLFAFEIHALGVHNIQVDSGLNEPLKAHIKIIAIPIGAILTINATADYSSIQKTLDWKTELTSKTSILLSIFTSDPVKEPTFVLKLHLNWTGGDISREYSIVLNPFLYEKAQTALIPTTQLETENIPNSIATQLDTVNNPPVIVTTPPKKKVIMGTYIISYNDNLWKIAKRTLPKGVSMRYHMFKIYTHNPNAFINGNKKLIKLGETLHIPDWDGTQAQQSAVPHIQDATTPQTEIAQLTDDNSTLQSENRLLQSEIKKTYDVVQNKEQQLKKVKEALTTQNQKIAELEDTIKEQEKKLVSSLSEKTEHGEEKPINQGGTGTEPIDAITPDSIDDTLDNLEVMASETGIVVAQANKGEETPINNDGGSTVVPNKESDEKPVNIEEETVATTQDGNTVETSGEEVVKTEEKVVKTEEKVVKTEEKESHAAKQDKSEESDFITLVTDLVKQIPGGWFSIGGGTLVFFFIGGFLIWYTPRTKQQKQIQRNKELDDSDLDDETEQTSMVAMSQVLKDRANLGEAYEQSFREEINRITLKQNTEHEDNTKEVDVTLEQELQEQPDSAEIKEEIDPVFDKELKEKVDVYLAYADDSDPENFKKAEELVISAIEQYPFHHDYRLNLLEIYAAAQETDKFEEQYTILSDTIDTKSPLKKKADELWHNLSPGLELPSEKSSISTALPPILLKIDDIDEPEVGMLRIDDTDNDLLSLVDKHDKEVEKDLDQFNEPSQTISMEDDTATQVDSFDDFNLDDSIEEIPQHETELNTDLTAEDSVLDDVEDDINEQKDDLGLELDDIDDLGTEFDDVSVSTLSVEEVPQETDNELSLDDDMSLEEDINNNLSLDEELPFIDDISQNNTEISLDEHLEVPEDESLKNDDTSSDNVSLATDDTDDLSLESFSLNDTVLEEEISLSDNKKLETDELSLEIDSLDDEIGGDENYSLEDDGLSSNDSLGDDLTFQDEFNALGVGEDDLFIGEDNVSSTDNENLHTDELSLANKFDSLDDEIGGDENYSLEDDGLSSNDFLGDDLTLEDELATIDTDDVSSDNTEKLETDDLSLDDLELNEPLDDLLSNSEESPMTDDFLDDKLLDDELFNDTSEVRDDIDNLLEAEDAGKKFETAQSYIDSEDNTSARHILEEISEQGTDEEKQKAQAMIATLT